MGQASTVEVFAIGFLLALSIMFMVIFNMAVLNGGSVVATVNDYGEMVPELLLLHFVVWPTITVGLYQLHRRNWDD